MIHIKVALVACAAVVRGLRLGTFTVAALRHIQRIRSRRWDSWRREHSLVA